MERTLLVSRRSRQQRADLEFWLSQPVEVRIAAVEPLRAQAHQGNWCNTSGSTAVAPASRNNAAATVTDQPLR